jgi:hypothetical protein
MYHKGFAALRVAYRDCLIAAIRCAFGDLSYSLLVEVQEERGIVCVCMWGRRCRAATVRVKSCALCCLSNPGAWDVVDLHLQAWPGQTVCLRPVRSRIGQRIDRPTNQPSTPTTISRKCDTTRSAACVIRKQSPLPPDAGNANPRDYLFGSEDRVLGAIPKSNHKPESGIVEQGDKVRVPCSCLHLQDPTVTESAPPRDPIFST